MGAPDGFEHAGALVRLGVGKECIGELCISDGAVLRVERFEQRSFVLRSKMDTQDGNGVAEFLKVNITTVAEIEVSTCSVHRHVLKLLTVCALTHLFANGIFQCVDMLPVQQNHLFRGCLPDLPSLLHHIHKIVILWNVGSNFGHVFHEFLESDLDRLSFRLPKARAVQLADKFFVSFFFLHIPTQNLWVNGRVIDGLHAFQQSDVMPRLVELGESLLRNPLAATYQLAFQDSIDEHLAIDQFRLCKVPEKRPKIEGPQEYATFRQQLTPLVKIELAIPAVMLLKEPRKLLDRSPARFLQLHLDLRNDILRCSCHRCVHSRLPIS
mmetsp:Transcript_21574/g.43318  ORF Transcript_21574/g.43318 Transcript_21574/m.43318 type:complete len:325 (+) Transcript_21574:595-1569(+)